MRSSAPIQPRPVSHQTYWTPGPARPRLAAGEVHVWRAELTAVSHDLVELLSRDELNRVARFQRAQDGALWARAHGLLRTLLGRYTNREPHTLRFATGTQGKPHLIEDRTRSLAGADANRRRGSSRPYFNLSHSSQVALYAFDALSPIGVDVEVAHRSRDVVAVAARAFGATEARRLERLDPQFREREFLRSWVRHEAELKCRGAGLGAPGARQTAPWIVGLELGPDAVGAVAVERGPHEIRCWDWDR